MDEVGPVGELAERLPEVEAEERVDEAAVLADAEDDQDGQRERERDAAQRFVGRVPARARAIKGPQQPRSMRSPRGERGFAPQPRGLPETLGHEESLSSRA